MVVDTVTNNPSRVGEFFHVGRTGPQSSPITREKYIPVVYAKLFIVCNNYTFFLVTHRSSVLRPSVRISMAHPL
jgi:hypothetical protein